MLCSEPRSEHILEFKELDQPIFGGLHENELANLCPYQHLSAIQGMKDSYSKIVFFCTDASFSLSLSSESIKTSIRINYSLFSSQNV